MIIDAHQHVWNLEKCSYPWLGPESGPLYRNFEASELAPVLNKIGVDKTVLIQAMDSYEDTESMLETAAACSWIGGVVGWVPLDRPEEASRSLERYSSNPLFKGVRHLIHGEQDPDWLLRGEVLEGLRLLEQKGLTYDVVAVFPHHLKHIPVLSEKLPHLRMVIDHLAKPPFHADGWEEWARQMKQAAENPNVFAKLSGLNTAAGDGWSAETLRPCIEYAVNLFGADRLMFGSDWPVALLNGSYEEVWEQTHLALSGFSEAEKDAIFGGTAARFYRISEDAE
ncbi:amidohydrolase family protein [Cohnella herbarum]|uniref:Amidohydrolase family protein n=1 Tax=Cohnella herbarum TaxID=2728023 RepID=A0A7Z2VPJ4_9BACL|nr:amidohydrolase family protein [Cohnella herbarum]QJD86844.1 amidohydrolase family protein [Cohnella herbarum]